MDNTSSSEVFCEFIKEISKHYDKHSSTISYLLNSKKYVSPGMANPNNFKVSIAYEIELDHIQKMFYSLRPEHNIPSIKYFKNSDLFNAHQNSYSNGTVYPGTIKYVSINGMDVYKYRNCFTTPVMAHKQNQPECSMESEILKSMILQYPSRFVRSVFLKLFEFDHARIKAEFITNDRISTYLMYKLNNGVAIDEKKYLTEVKITKYINKNQYKIITNPETYKSDREIYTMMTLAGIGV